MKHILETWNDEQTVLEYLRVTPAHLRAWRKSGALSFVVGCYGRMYSKQALSAFIVREYARYAKAVTDTRVAAENEEIRRTQLSLDL